MEITNIKIFKIKPKGALRGYCNIVLNNSFIIRGIKILENKRNGRFISMPSRRLIGEKRAYRDLCHPINQETREVITKAIWDTYDAILTKQ